MDIKEIFRTEGQGPAEKILWEDHWRSLKKDKEWSDKVLVQATALFTEMDIKLVMTTGMPEVPFKMIGGNMDDRTKDCPGFPMWIGYKNNIHYQSLLPNDDELPYPRSCRRKKDQEAEDRHSPKEEQPGDKILINNNQNATEHEKQVRNHVKKGSCRVSQMNQQR